VPPSPAGGATAHHLVLLQHCPGETAELHVTDARTGKVAWTKKVGKWRQNIRLQTHRGAIGVTLDDEIKVYAESGGQLLHRTAAPGTELALTGEANGTLYLDETDIDDRSVTLHAVRAGTTTSRWTLRQGPLIGMTHISDGLIVGGTDAEGAYDGDLRWLPGDARVQGPGASSLTDVDGHRSDRVPWPVAGAFVGMSGDLLVVRSDEKDGTRYTGLRPGRRALDAEHPAALGGVARKDWPDACGLVDGKLLAGLDPGYVKLPVAKSRTVLGAELPHPSECRFATESGSDSDIFSVTVRWVAPDEQAARTYAANAVPWGCSPALGGCVTAEISRPRSGVALYTYRTGLAAKPVAHATVAVGRYVFGVSAGTDEPRVRERVRRVALHLSRHTEADSGS
ncbi:hypothetical protein, partial [Streptomyces boluensis]